MQEKDYYRILGVDKGAGDEEIKKAFRRLAHQCHPDKSGGAKESEEQFKLINEAYEVLKDPDKRAQYDRFGQVGAGHGGYREQGFGADFDDLFGEVFSGFFNGNRRRPGPERGADLRYDLELTFEEAASGCEKKVDVTRAVVCAGCKGTGAKAGTAPAPCAACGGRGQVRFQQGFLTIARPCHSCRGQGVVIKNPCSECSGRGRVEKAQTISIQVPAGVDNGMRVRVTGQGEPGQRGGPNGDLYAFASVLPHTIFRREEDDLVCEVAVSFTQAALGAEIEVPTLGGRETLKIPAGTQSGRVFKLKGKGISSVQTGRRGDEQVVIKVETPVRLTKRQRELLIEFSSISGEDSAPHKGNFFSKVKEIFE
ncbi:MAG: molecular chaperone DnaJ [Deltaproteobacteria bacterium]|nr:molecular chaperone DnaJ [Deltaproteobacteria bacterium]